MPRYIRSSVPGATYFFTVTIADRSSDALVRHVNLLREAYVKVRRRHPFETIAICVLPEHLHCIWQLPEGDADFAIRWQQIKHGFSLGVPERSAMRLSLRAKRERGLWQRRYWEHLIRDEDDLRRHVEYIHFNPVKHGQVQAVAEWPFSSFHRWVARGLVPVEWGSVQAADGGFGE